MSRPTGRELIVRQTVAQLAAQAHERVSAAFDPAVSPWHGRPIFITGAPRSGTSWLHQMLLTHPEVATAGEMHAFCEGLDAVFANFENPDPYMNLSTWVTRDELLTLTRAFVDGMFSATVAATRPDATRVLDKTPNHALCARRMAEVYPDATYIHIIRNPRDALSSARDLWADWNPELRDWRAAAAGWRGTVLDCRTQLSGLRYHEVRYEDLLTDPHRHLAEILGAAGLSHDDEYVAAAVDFGKAPVNVRPSDRRISADKWAAIDPAAEQDVVSVAGELMVELGYIDGAERDRILARRSLRRSVGTLRSTLRGSATATGAKARQRAAARRQAPASVQAVSRRLVAAATARDLAAVTALLSSDVVLEAEGGARSTGAQLVAGRLCDVLGGARAIPVTADRHAAAVEVMPDDGRRQQHRYYVGRGKVTRIVIEGGGR
ncbi:MAG TPA: sulfotransferase [Mycobacteriales bacterium]|jgi:hypothetical protein|nr:sulfotransferase [Mycobacteriales bacterium]